VRNRVVDSSSIEVNRRARRTKTGRLDALKLVMMLVRVCCGERHVWQEMRVPSAEAEAARDLSRERTALTKEQPAVESDHQLVDDVGERRLGARAEERRPERVGSTFP
jgi:transposase